MTVTAATRHGATASAAATKRFVIGLLPCDGIGHEVVPAAKRILEAIQAPFLFVPLDAGFEHFQKTGTALPTTTIDVLRNECQGSIFGAVSSPSHKVEGYSSPIVRLRKELSLFANIRPVIDIGTSSPSSSGKQNLNMVIFRENTECLYIKQEKLETLPDGTKMATAVRKITETASKNIAKAAFDMAVSRQKNNISEGKVTIVHKSNVLAITDGLFRETCLNVAKDYPSIRVQEQLVDSMVYKLYRNPFEFDVVVAPNMYGDIISDAAAALVGSLGLVPSINYGINHCMAEPVHGSAPDIAGKEIANPIACIRSASMLLENFGYVNESKQIESAIATAVSDGFKTPDIGGSNSTEQVTKAIIERL